VGSLAKSEEVTAEAELATRQENLINAKSNLAKTKLSLLQLINPPRVNLWNRDINLLSTPENPAEKLADIEQHVMIAMQMRPELNQAKLQWQRDELEIVKTKNGLLPQLDLFITLGKTGYADSFGRSAENIAHKNNYDIIGGITFEYPPVNRGAEARNLRAVITRDQAREAINNLSQTIEVDVRDAYLEIIRTKEQVAATAVTRKLQEEKLRVEIEKFRVGLSTSLLVAQTERDLFLSQIAENFAVVNHIKAFVEFYRLEGTLLERRGIASPGRETVKLADISVR
jgi:outer membrane protein TolC